MNNSIIDDILTEWAYRVPNGMPNPKDPYHIVILSESLDEMKFPRKAKSILLNKLREESKKVYKSNWPGGKAPKGVKLHKGSRGGIYYFGNPETGEPDVEDERVERERIEFQRKLKEADKNAASDEEREEALGGWVSKPNKYKEAHDEDIKDNTQPLKNNLSKLLSGIKHD